MVSERKSSSVRLKEAMDVRANLERMGLLVEPKNVELVRNHMNAFVRGDGCSRNFKLRVKDDCSLSVVLACDAAVESGITVVHG